MIKINLEKKFTPSKKNIKIKEGRTNFAEATQEFLNHAEIINKGSSELSDIRAKYADDLKQAEKRIERYLKSNYLSDLFTAEDCEKYLAELREKKKQAEKAVRDYMPKLTKEDKNLYLAYYWYQVKPEKELYNGEFETLYKRAFMEWFDSFGMVMGTKWFKFFNSKLGVKKASNKNYHLGKEIKLTKEFAIREFIEMLYRIIIELMIKKGLIKVYEFKYEKIDWKVVEKDRKTQKENQTVQNPEKSKKELPQIGLKDFVVRRSVFKCSHSEHSLEDIVATINILDKENELKLVKVNASYCSTCKIYFMLENTYQDLKKKGILICRVTDEKTYLKNSVNCINEMVLAQQSVLMQYGYNVNQTEALSTIRRQKILAVLIDKGILTKSEIISYLEFFINMKQYNAKFETAVAKWEMDIEFVENYRFGEYHEYGVNGIYRR